MQLPLLKIKPTEISPALFQRLILKWFDKAGRKHLPWQQNKTPYRVWVSEIMLQQTQVTTVIPYFERFMQAFPDLITLANAAEDDVLHLWAGLGYYSRARNLHRAAKIIIEKFHGRFPDTLAELQSLPGIGQSTAGAILSIAFNQPAAILDGNVKRVLARFHAVTDPINEKIIENKLWAFANAYMPLQRVADYTQAMMDLGATCCVRGKPQCEACPLIKYCLGCQQGIAADLPKKKATRRLPVRIATFVILKNGDTIFLYKRPAKGIWGSLWSLPEIQGEPELALLQTFCRRHFQFAPATYAVLNSFRHTFSHYHLDIFPILIDITNRSKKARSVSKEGIAEAEQIWYNLRKPASIGLPKPIQFILKGLL